MIMSARRSNFTLEFLCLTRINLSPWDQFEDLSNEYFPAKHYFLHASLSSNVGISSCGGASHSPSSSLLQ